MTQRPDPTCEKRLISLANGEGRKLHNEDPEDLREVISAYQKCVAGTVQRFGGFVAKYMGDGVLIYFGFPEAHEDDAERAVESAIGRRLLGRGDRAEPWTVVSALFASMFDDLTIVWLNKRGYLHWAQRGQGEAIIAAVNALIGRRALL